MKAIELFCCAGGMAEGFRRAGISFAQAFDFSPDACASYEHNLGHRPIQIDVRDLVRMARDGWSPGPLDLLVADPPCAPWSRAGKRKGLDDERDMLHETVELIRLLRPRAYLIGNVPGLDDGNNLAIVQEMIGGLSREGYCTADFARLDASTYGVPQRRVRPFWYGHLHGEGPCITWPAPTHGAFSGSLTFEGLGLLPLVTCRDALGHLPESEIGRPVQVKKWDPKTAKPSTWKPSTKGPQGKRLGGPDTPGATITAKPSRVGAGEAHTLTWPWDRPATTIYAGDRIAPPSHEAGSYLSGPNAIVLSEKAAAILQGFPETWLFSGATKTARWAQLGQAVPPAVAEAVALSVKRALAR